MKKKYIPLMIGLAMAFGVILGSKLNFSDATEKIFATNSKKDKLNRLIDYIDYEYVDEVNTDSIVDVTVNGILANLDPHSVYIPSDSYEENADDMRGNFVGIGISFYVYKDTIAVIRTIAGGPAEKAGIKAGDRLLYADGQKIFGGAVPRDSVTNYLKGALDSKVVLQVYRKGEDELLKFKVNRSRIPIASLDASYMITDRIGYIKINRFSETTYREFKKELDRLIEEGMTKLILDLRDNPGGYISSAEKIVDEFLEKDKLILITRNKSGKDDYTYATGKGDFEAGQVYVLINENSASASEIVAGAIQDNDKGLIVGRRSFGKGLVQREMALGDGSAIRLTIARYYTPTGRSIQRPYGKGNNDYYRDYENRYRNGEMISADSIRVNDSLRYVTPKGKVVYGGGGIIPDIFISKDISIEKETLNYITRNGYISYFIFEYLERDRDRFGGITPEDFINNYEVGEDLTNEFLEYSRLNESNVDFEKYRGQLNRILKASIAQQLFGSNVFESILNENDPMISKIIEVENRDR